jgi:hypothetical protein
MSIYARRVNEKKKKKKIFLLQKSDTIQQEIGSCMLRLRGGCEAAKELRHA